MITTIVSVIIANILTVLGCFGIMYYFTKKKFAQEAEDMKKKIESKIEEIEHIFDAVSNVPEEMDKLYQKFDEFAEKLDNIFPKK